MFLSHSHFLLLDFPCRYIFGKNSATEKIPMTTPVFTQTFDSETSKVSIQIVIPSDKDMNR